MAADQKKRRRFRPGSGPRQNLTLRLLPDEWEAVRSVQETENLCQSAAAAILIRRGAKLKALKL
jgi:predicted DNA-binding protein (UPF0251 family)